MKKKKSTFPIRWTKKWFLTYSKKRRKTRKGIRNGGITRRSKPERRKPGAESRPLLAPEKITMETLSWLPAVKSILRFREVYASTEKQKLEVDYLPSDLRKRLIHAKEHLKKSEEGFNESFVPLTEVEQRQVSVAFQNSNRHKILVTHQNSNIDITGQVLQCLKPGGWLNDEVINVYFGLLKEREQREPEKFLKCHFFNTFFYTKLISGGNGYDFISVRRWTTQRKIGYGLLECDKIFVPIHTTIHWCLAVIDKKNQKFQYLDSLKGTDYQVLKNLARYYKDEVKDKTGKDINTNSWTFECAHDIPHQENGSDCGMFMMKYADFYSRDLALWFSQKDMPYFRKRTAKEILSLKAE